MHAEICISLRGGDRHQQRIGSLLEITATSKEGVAEVACMPIGGRRIDIAVGVRVRGGNAG
jgi:hypothetical protein